MDLLHLFQGLYAMSMNCMEAAEAQFNTAVSVSTLISVHMGYLRSLPISLPDRIQRKAPIRN